MSRPWTSRDYASAQSLWDLLDEQSRLLELQAQDELVISSESYKMLLLGRREMIEVVRTWLAENESALGEILSGYGVTYKDEE